MNYHIQAFQQFIVIRGLICKFFSIGKINVFNNFLTVCSAL